MTETTATERNYTTPISSYQIGEYSGKNTSGWEPTGDCVLVLPDQPIKKTAGGILMPEASVDRHAQAAESGVCVAAGPDAFVWNSDRTRKLESGESVVGKRVVFNRYSGIYMHGDDGQKYMIMVDHSIKASRPIAPDSAPAKKKKN